MFDIAKQANENLKRPPPAKFPNNNFGISENIE